MQKRSKHLSQNEELSDGQGLSVLSASDHLLPTGGGDPAPALDRPSRATLNSRAEVRQRLNFARGPDVLLAGILDECHFLMREVASASALRAQTVQDRIAFVHTALSCARTGAKVGTSIAAMQNMPMSIDRANAIALELTRLDRESDS